VPGIALVWIMRRRIDALDTESATAR
jgi:hypothetical protein